MQKRRSRSRPALLSCGLLFVLIATLPLLTWRTWKQEQLNHALLQAVYHETTADIAMRLRQGADPNTREANSPSTWQDILHHWLHPAPALRTDTVLMVASRQGYLADAQCLLKAGAQVNAVNAKGETALTIAFTAHHPKLMQALLEQGANPNVTTPGVNDLPVPLLIGVLSEKYQLNNFDPSTLRTFTQTMLEKGVNVNAVDADGETSLIAALSVGEPQIAEWLIARGVDINHVSNSGDTALHLSTGDPNNRSVLKSLLKRGVDIAPAHNDGWNILCWAVEEDDLFVAQQLLRREMSVDSRDKRGRTPLMYAMYAAVHGNKRFFDLLLSQGADVNAHDSMGWTALMFAAQTDDLNLVNTLLRKGANRQLRDREQHWTAEQRAIHMGQERAAHLLRTGHASGNLASTLEEIAASERWTYHSRPFKRVPVDAHRWIETLRLPNIKQEGGNGAWGARVVDAHGRHGKPVGGETFFFQPAAKVFHDTDGSPFAFLRGHHRSEVNYIVSIRGLKLVKQGDFYAEYGASCQPLPTGGILIICQLRTRDMYDLPSSHKQDEVAEVYRFQHGKWTDLGRLFWPGQ